MGDSGAQNRAENPSGASDTSDCGGGASAGESPTIGAAAPNRNNNPQTNK